MRNPVGHLPPSIYWRRRVLVLLGLALLIALIAWACVPDGDGSGNKDSAGSKSTPSASASGKGSGSAPPPVVPGQTTPPPGAIPPPGGGSGTGTAGSTGEANGGAANGGAAAGGTAGTGGTQPGGAVGGAGGAGGTGVTGDKGGQSGGGANVDPAAVGLPLCNSPALKLVLISPNHAQDSRFRAGADQVPLQLTATNTGPTACAVDLSQKAVKVEVTSGPDRIWNSADCRQDASLVTRLEPNVAKAFTWNWSWTRSNPGQCGAAPQGVGSPPSGALFIVKGSVNGVEWASNDYKFTVS
jgi:hypothetical protein